MRKRIFAAFCCVLLLIGLLPAQAAPVELKVVGPEEESRAAEQVFVVDEAGLLTVGEADRLEGKARSVSEQYGCGLYIITVDDYRDFGPSAWDAACSIYQVGGFGYGSEKNGLALLLSMDDRDFATAVYGTYARSVFNDDVLQLQEAEFLDDFRENDWYSGFSDFLNFAEEALDCQSRGTTIQAERSRLDLKKLSVILLQDVAIAAVVAILVCLILKAGMRSVRKGSSAAAYMDTARSNLTLCTDQFTHATETRRTIERSSSGGGGGGGSRSHSGGGFSGRSGKF